MNNVRFPLPLESYEIISRFPWREENFLGTNVTYMEASCYTGDLNRFSGEHVIFALQEIIESGRKVLVRRLLSHSDDLGFVNDEYAKIQRELKLDLEKICIMFIEDYHCSDN